MIVSDWGKKITVEVTKKWNQRKCKKVHFKIILFFSDFLAKAECFLTDERKNLTIFPLFFPANCVLRQKKKLSSKKGWQPWKLSSDEMDWSLLTMIFIVFFLIFLSPLTDSAFPCSQRDVAFELMTGVVFTAPEFILDTRSGVLLLEECISICNGNSSCMSVNYETGLCVLFTDSADQYPGNLEITQRWRVVDGEEKPLRENSLSS